MYPKILLAALLFFGLTGWLAAEPSTPPPLPSPAPNAQNPLPVPMPQKKAGGSTQSQKSVTVITPREGKDAKSMAEKPTTAMAEEKSEKKNEEAMTETVRHTPPPAPANLPSRGITKEIVKSKFGDPQKVINATGVPPIERWVYDSFTVYFEREHVIHSVAHNQSTQ